MMSLSLDWGLRVDPSVLKVLKRIPRDDADRILDVIELMPENPYFGDISKMSGMEDVWRRRVGSYRIFYRIMEVDKTILIFRIERRTSKTY